MIDLLLDDDWDLALDSEGDIIPSDSVQQDILIRLKWIQAEWRLGPDLGFPWFEETLIKDPDTTLIAQYIKDEIMELDDIVDAAVEVLEYDPAKRTLSIEYTAWTDEETFESEVELYG